MTEIKSLNYIGKIKNWDVWYQSKLIGKDNPTQVQFILLVGYKKILLQEFNNEWYITSQGLSRIPNEYLKVKELTDDDVSLEEILDLIRPKNDFNSKV